MKMIFFKLSRHCTHIVNTDACVHALMYICMMSSTYTYVCGRENTSLKPDRLGEGVLRMNEKTRADEKIYNNFDHPPD